MPRGGAFLLRVGPTDRSDGGAERSRLGSNRIHRAVPLLLGIYRRRTHVVVPRLCVIVVSVRQVVNRNIFVASVFCWIALASTGNARWH